jgi:hypothetical protein
MMVSALNGCTLFHAADKPFTDCLTQWNSEAPRALRSQMRSLGVTRALEPATWADDVNGRRSRGCDFLFFGRTTSSEWQVRGTYRRGLLSFGRLRHTPIDHITALVLKRSKPFRLTYEARFPS